MAIEKAPPRLPITVRLIGTNDVEARRLLEGSPLATAVTMDEVVQKTIAAARGEAA
jgi:succinyl-CoA synthetase beta subunit